VGILIKTTLNPIRFKNYVEFSSVNNFYTLLRSDYIVLESHTVLNFTSNRFNIGITSSETVYRAKFLLCAFQYINTHNKSKRLDTSDYHIIFKDNTGYLLFYKKHSTSHCDLIRQSTFLSKDSAVVNKKVIQYSNNRFTGSYIANG